MNMTQQTLYADREDPLRADPRGVRRALTVR